MDDCPTGLTKFFDEEIAQRERIQKEPIRPIAFGSISSSGPSIAVLVEIEIERRCAHGATSWSFTFIAVRKHHESAIPSRRHVDQVISAIEHALAHHSRVGGNGRRTIY
jgi:hypothetical protein